MISRRIFFIFFVFALLFSACNSDSQPQLEGKWDIVSALGDGREMAQDGDMFDFKSDGKMEAKVGIEVKTGIWRTEAAKNTLIVKSDSTAETRYDYQFHGDSLRLKTFVGKGHQLEFVCTPRGK